MATQNMIYLLLANIALAFDFVLYVLSEECRYTFSNRLRRREVFDNTFYSPTIVLSPTLLLSSRLSHDLFDPSE